MSIRVRILVVALVAVFSVGTGFYREYAMVRGHAAALEAEQARVAESMDLSAVVHELQKERGLTAGALVGRSAETRERRELQRRLTDAVLADHPLAFITASGDTAAEVLARLRARADASGADWAEVRGGYTALIRGLLDSMALNGRASGGAVGRSPLPPLAELAMARENLGLARAVLNRAYTRGRASPSELAELAGYYGGYSEGLRTFLRDIGADRRASLEAQVPESLRAQVSGEMEGVLGRGGVGHAANQAQHWWYAATRLIDGYKAVEDQVYRTYLLTTQLAVEEGRRELAIYGIAAVTATLLVAALTLFSLTRILKALGTLERTLHDVVEREDFDVRIALRGRDEFGQIAASINGLLRYTGDIIRQKDVLASTDLLTQISNRRHFIERAGIELQRANRHGQRVALVICDIDHFKSVNDRFGHARGDEVLRGFAALLAHDRRASDLVARWGGEEFIILLSEGGDGEALGLVERLRAETERLDFGSDLKVTASFGVAYRRPGESLDDVVKRADAALYRAKREGRNRVAIAD